MAHSCLVEATPSRGDLLVSYEAPGRRLETCPELYLLSTPLSLGFLWIGSDAGKQGSHGKLAGTVVVHRSSLRT